MGVICQFVFYMSFFFGNGFVQISVEQIKVCIQEFVVQICSDYVGQWFYLICVFNGVFMFYIDLVWVFDMFVIIDFMQVSSYGIVKQLSGEVWLVKDFVFFISDWYVIMVDDIVDIGIIMSYLLYYFQGCGLVSLKVVVLFSKFSCCKVEVLVDYFGFIIFDVFVYGYGFDWV